jgi:hypothetical protein
VSGFREAVVAAQDPRAPTPQRLAIVSPDEAGAAWLERWAEDVEQVRRRVALRRADGVEITVVATLASYGDGIPTSLAVESIRPLQGGAILRSGVHPRAEVEAAIAHYEASRSAAPGWAPPPNPGPSWGTDPQPPAPVRVGPADVP